MPARKKIFLYIYYLLLGLPLLLYPFVLLANVMSLSGVSSNAFIYVKVAVNLFAVATATYPISYIGSLVYVVFRYKRHHQLSWWFTAPTLHIMFIVLTFLLWGLAQQFG